MKLKTFLLTILSFSLYSTSNAESNESSGIVIGPVGQLYITNSDVAPDGYIRSAAVVNGAFPAPLIQAKKGDRFAIEVFNDLTDSTMPLETSIHWHGLFQKKSNWADGVSYVTQCPLRQKQSFEYRFHPTHQTGTYWYHSHYSTQYCDGLRGPLVIYDPADPLAHLYDVDNEATVITLADWYHEPSIQLGESFTAVLSNSTLINGRGRYSDGPSTALSVVNVTYGLRYRFRVVSLSCDPSFNFTIDGHRMTIIEVDGNEVEPVEVDSIPIFVGQRYSVVVTANQAVGNYWIRALSSVSGSSYSGDQNLAILRYEGAIDENPSSSATCETAFDESSLHPLINPGAPGVPEIGKADVNLKFYVGSNSSSYFTINNVSFDNPTVPVLLQILSGARSASQLLPNGSVYVLPSDKVIEISFPDPTAAPGSPHPIHIHGHAFDVVRVAGTNAANFKNPVRRDVVSIGNSSTDSVTIRFKTDNAGPWILHCHINWHLHHGLAVVMAEAPDLAAAQESAVAPAAWYQLCKD